MRSAQSAGQVWRGKVTKVMSDGTVWAVVPQLFGQEPLGPMPSHGIPSVGASVLVVLLGGSRQDMIAVPDPAVQIAQAIAPITVAAAAWAPANPVNAAAVSQTWDANLGWVTWVDLGLLAVRGDVTLTFPNPGAAQAVARPSGWQVRVFTQGVSGVVGLRPKVDYLAGGTVTGSNAQLSLAVWPDWAYQIDHDFILPAAATARPTFVALSVAPSATGRIGLTAPLVATKSERSQ